MAIERVMDATSHLLVTSFRGMTPSKIKKLNELLVEIFNNISD